jgi:hypothetical protein
VRGARRAVVLLTGLALVGLPAVTAESASAAPSATLGKVPCVNQAGARLAPGTRETPEWREHGDTTAVTQADLDALPAPAEVQRQRSIAPGDAAPREVAPSLPSRVSIPTYVHVIKGTHRGERTPIGPKRVRKMISVLNNGMAGKQNRLSAPTRYRFTLMKTTFTKREGWYHAYFYGPRDKRMKRALHVGNARTLNLYINGGGPRGQQPALGWSRFPWQYAGAPRLDGVTVNVAALYGGEAAGYNLDDTAIHETGHWLGLFHTFQGGCSSQGDLVADTAAEAEPSFYCETTRDTCAAPGLDPVRNFMDYSEDACMNMLTQGQVDRMDRAVAKWRL